MKKNPILSGILVSNTGLYRISAIGPVFQLNDTVSSHPNPASSTYLLSRRLKPHSSSETLNAQESFGAQSSTLLETMARFNNKKRPFVKPIAKKKLATVDHITGDKIPKSFVFSRGRLPGPLRQLKADLKQLMNPHTALHLKEKKSNTLKDFLNVAGPYGVTHFLILSKTPTAPYLRVATTPQGPTLTFKIEEYSLAVDIKHSQKHPRCPKDLFKNPPMSILSGFGSGGGRNQEPPQLKLISAAFRNLFPSIDVNTVKLSSCQRILLLHYNEDTKLIDFRHYSIRLEPVGVSRRISKFVQKHQVPDLRNLQDVSDFVTKAGYGSESEGDEEAATVTLGSDLGRVNRASSKSAIKLQEIGPRMTLRLIKVENGLCQGAVLFSEYGDAKKAEDNNEDAETEEDDDEAEDDENSEDKEEEDDDDMEEN